MSGMSAIQGSGGASSAQQMNSLDQSSQDQGGQGINQQDFLKLLMMIIKMMMENEQKGENTGENKEPSHCGNKGEQGPAQSSASPVAGTKEGASTS